MATVLAGTGHRPPKLGGYGNDTFAGLTGLARDMLEEMAPDRVISGMALGWDQALAWAAEQECIPFVAAIPFRGYCDRWPASSKDRYESLLSSASEVEYVCEPGYAPWKMQKRNEWMVDKCDVLLAMWDGSTGGTANCIDYARRRGTRIVNCWDRLAERIAGGLGHE